MNRCPVGSLMIEALAAVTLAVLALAGVSQLLVIAAQQQQAMECRRLAHREAANLMEQAMARPYEQVTNDQLATFMLSSDVQKRLRAPRLRVNVVQIEDSLATKQVEIEVVWESIARQPENVRLAAWKSPAGN